MYIYIYVWEIFISKNLIHQLRDPSVRRPAAGYVTTYVISKGAHSTVVHHRRP